MAKHSIRTRPWRLALVTSLVTGCLGACGTAPSSTGNNSLPPATTPSPTPSPMITPLPLAPAQLARRLALDLTLGLPSATDVASLTADPTTFPALVDVYLKSASGARALAMAQPRVWRLNSQKLPDLDRMIQDGDTALGQALTPAVRQDIVREPGLLVRQILSQHLPFSQLFTGAFGIVPPTLLSLWQATSGGNAFTGEPDDYVTYADHRPSAGILADDGFLATTSGSWEGQQARADDILSRFLCLDRDSSPQHGFGSLTAAEVKTDLGVAAASNKNCAGCHSSLAAAGTVLSGLGYNKTFANWVTYSATPPVSIGSENGVSLTDLASLGATLAADQRTASCELSRLSGTLYQRSAGGNDNSTLAAALTEMTAAQGDLTAGVRQILLSPEYAYAPVGAAVKGVSLRHSSGVRLINLAQWQGLAETLAPGAAALELTDGLDPGQDETFTADDMIPSGAYFHRVDRLARQLAAQIVSSELTAGVTAPTRRVLVDLPDGTGAGATPAQVAKQLKDAWAILTGVQLAEADPTLTSLQVLWTKLKPDGSAAGSQRAWQIILVAMLTHPQFLLY